MTSINDPMAAEQLRTIMTDRIEYADESAGQTSTADHLGGELLTEFPGVTFERMTNEHGVHVRRVAGRTAWEVDPEPNAPWPAPRTSAYALEGHVVDAAEIEAWIKRHRDRDRRHPAAVRCVDAMLDDLRDHFVTGTPLDQDVAKSDNG